MSCCGRRRQSLGRPRQAPEEAGAAPPPTVQDPTALRYRGGRSLVVKGPVTGLVYLFAANGASLDVDGRDAPELIATGWFS